MTLLQALRHLRKYGPQRPLVGICSNAEKAADRDFDMPGLLRAMGLPSLHPVLCPAGRNAADAYLCSSAAEMWDRTPGTYGANRWALLDQMIAFIEENPEWNE